MDLLRRKRFKTPAMIMAAMPGGDFHEEWHYVAFREKKLYALYGVLEEEYVESEGTPLGVVMS